MLPDAGYRGNKSLLFSQTSFCMENSDGITKCQVFSQANKNLNRMIEYQLKQQYYCLGLQGFY